MSIKKGATALAVGSLVCIALSGLRSPAVARQEEKKAHTAGPPISKAVAILLPTKGSKVEGRVTFTQTDEQCTSHDEISGLAPGDHGFHIHEFGVWSPGWQSSGWPLQPDCPACTASGRLQTAHR